MASTYIIYNGRCGLKMYESYPPRNFQCAPRNFQCAPPHSVEPSHWSMEGVGTWLQGASTHDMRVTEQVQKHNENMQSQQKFETKVANFKLLCDQRLQEAQQENMATQSALHDIMQRLQACAHLIKEREQKRDELLARVPHR